MGPLVTTVTDCLIHVSVVFIMQYLSTALSMYGASLATAVIFFFWRVCKKG